MFFKAALCGFFLGVFQGVTLDSDIFKLASIRMQKIFSVMKREPMPILALSGCSLSS